MKYLEYASTLVINVVCHGIRSHLIKKNRCYNIFRLRSISLTELFPLTTSVPFSYFWSVTPFFSILVYLCCHLHRRRQSHPASLSLPKIHKKLKEECPNMFKSNMEIYFSWAAFASYQVLKLLSPSKTGAKKVLHNPVSAVSALPSSSCSGTIF